MAKITLTQLVETGDSLVVDSSSLLYGKRRGESLPEGKEGKRKESARITALLDRLSAHARGGSRIYTTSAVRDELTIREQSVEYLRRQVRKMIENGIITPEYKTELEFYMQKGEEAMARLRFFEALGEKEQIIKSFGKNGDETSVGVSFNHVQRKNYLRLDEQLGRLQKTYEISDVDFDLIKVGMILLTSKHEPVTIVSNDGGIRDALEEIRGTRSRYRRMGYALRVGPFTFEYTADYHSPATPQ